MKILPTHRQCTTVQQEICMLMSMSPISPREGIKPGIPDTNMMKRTYWKKMEIIIIVKNGKDKSRNDSAPKHE